MQPDGHDDKKHGKPHEHRLLQPRLAVLDAQTELDHIPHQLGVVREVLADTRARLPTERAVRGEGDEEGAEAEIRDGVVSVEPDVRRSVLDDAP